MTSLDHEYKRVTVEAEIRYGDLCQYLHNHCYEVHNLASLPHITIAGACATATHGSGRSARQSGYSGFRMDFTPSAGDELQSEYFVSRKDAYHALCAIDQIREYISPLLHVSEVRSIAEDDLWMSPCYKQDSVAMHFTWKADWEAVQQVLPMI